MLLIVTFCLLSSCHISTCLYISYSATQASTSATPDNPSRAKNLYIHVIEDESAPTYSSLGPEYDTIIDSRRQQNVKNQIPSHVRERYEFAEIHVDTDS